MAAATGREAADLTARLLAEPKTFSLGQALRLLGYMHARTPEEWRAFVQNNTIIRPWLSLAFPSTEVAAIEEREERPQYVITATGFGLYSTMGPLPTLYTEELLEEARLDESVSRDFLDILNNHLARLRYAANLHNRLERRTVENRNRDAAHIQFCLMGQAHPSLREPGLPKARLTEIFARRTRSAAQLELYLGHVLDRGDVRVEQCVERRAPIPADQRCRLGRANARLGADAMLGQCLRDSTGKFRIHLEHVEPDDMRRFLPGQAGHEALAAHLRRFLDAPLDYELALHPAGHEPPARPLGVDSAVGFYLGAPQVYPPVRVFWNRGFSAPPSDGVINA
ncbi:MAG: type VI secretion system baseplate subunit TssG [Desulfovibrio desulfuricans]|jgi:type VI secretion system protein ImpH|nr:type VI secretion system baseplate subunit TssG [Desulfovibrio desulfuricans]